MVTENPDALVQFKDVRVIRSTQAVLCRIGERSVWLPRWHDSSATTPGEARLPDVRGLLR